MLNKLNKERQFLPSNFMDFVAGNYMSENNKKERNKFIIKLIIVLVIFITLKLLAT